MFCCLFFPGTYLLLSGLTCFHESLFNDSGKNKHKSTKLPLKIDISCPNFQFLTVLSPLDYINAWTKAECVAQVAERLHGVVMLIPSTLESLHVGNAGMKEVMSGGPEGQGHPWLYQEFGATCL